MVKQSQVQPLVLQDCRRFKNKTYISSQQSLSHETFTGATSGQGNINYRANLIQNIQQLLDYADVIIPSLIS